MPFVSINPATGKKIRSYRAHTRADVERILDASEKAFQIWRDKPIAARAKVFERIARHLTKSSQRYGKLITKEMGKPISQAESEVKKSALVCTHYARNSHRTFTGRYEFPEGAPKGLRVVFEPFGHTTLAVHAFGTSLSGRRSVQPRPP